MPMGLSNIRPWPAMSIRFPTRLEGIAQAVSSLLDAVPRIADMATTIRGIAVTPFLQAGEPYGHHPGSIW